MSINHAVCSCKKFVMCGIVCRHTFCGLKQIGVTKFPRSLVLNRWMKIADIGSSSNSDVVYNDYFKMEQVSLKLTNIWFDFRQAVNKAGVQLDKLDHVHKAILQLNQDLDDCGDVNFTKKRHMAAMVGDQPVGEVTVLPPKVCKNKGNYFKRLVSEREKAITKSKKRIRKCKKCGLLTHDFRTCPDKNKVSTREEIPANDSSSCLKKNKVRPREEEISASKSRCLKKNKVSTEEEEIAAN